jgi:hypothetical protein
MISMPALMDRQRFQIRRDGARLGLACGEIENQFRSALVQAALSVVNALQKQGEREMKPPAESLFDNLAARVRKQDYISIGNLACEYRPDMIAIGKLKMGSKKLTARRRLQEILAEHVYGARVPVEELAAAVRRGIETGHERDCDF